MTVFRAIHKPDWSRPTRLAPLLHEIMFCLELSYVNGGATLGHKNRVLSMKTKCQVLLFRIINPFSSAINRLTPNNQYMGRTAPLTSKRCILYIYSTNIGTEYFKYAVYSPFFFSSKCSLFHDANLFGSCIIHILYTGCAKIKKILITAPKA